MLPPRATITVRHVFSEVPHFRRSRHDLLNPRKLVWKKRKSCFIADEKSHGLGTQRESCKKNDLLIVPTILGQGAPSFRKK